MMTHEYKLLCRILKEHSGIELGADRQDLVEARLRPLLREFELPSFAHLTLALMKPNADGLRSRVAQAVSVLETYFFRDKAPFNYFVEVMLPRLMVKRREERRIRIWCAASSTGQEPYSLAMLLAEDEKRLAGWKIEIVATDFVEDALRKAEKGLYSQFEVQRGMPVSMLVKYFDKVGNGWQIKPALRGRIAFREHNLLDGCQKLGAFDIIFCRNVLIYFDEQLKGAVLDRLSAQLASDGYIVLGAAETTTGLSADFMPVPDGHHGVFCFTPAAAAHRAAEIARRREAERNGDDRGSSDGSGAMPRLPIATLPKPEVRGADLPSEAGNVRAVKLDRQTADLLEARAKAGGLSLAELLAEFAIGEESTPADWQGLRLKAVAG
jgi:chemotaxis protein methyltransferase CheR